ncbi:alpha-S1-casein [Heterocephalus glaber]|uniref:Alpha-S1-casein n=1 Tax=Heterocephalus glaber TaxID=10181 RepID=A0AAX6SBU2_HETGA|nr:alpha-S1-casein [Heterocephalus glaber]
MKLLVLSCLVAAAAAMPSQQDSSSEETSNESTEEPMANSEEVVPSNTEQKCTPREDMLYQLNLEAGCGQEQFHRINEYNQAQVPFRQVYQLDVYPFAAWYYPQVQYLSFPPFFDNIQPIVSENIENTDVMPEWLN